MLLTRQPAESPHGWLSVSSRDAHAAEGATRALSPSVAATGLVWSPGARPSIVLLGPSTALANFQATPEKWELGTDWFLLG